MIVDRYIYDAVLNISLSVDLPLDGVYRFVDLFLKFNPSPDIVLLVDLPEQVAYQRKNDIQSEEYLYERRSCYLAMAKRYGFYILDGSEKPDVILEEALTLCQEMTRH